MPKLPCEKEWVLKTRGAAVGKDLALAPDRLKALLSEENRGGAE
jgi:hypothetical protein